MTAAAKKESPLKRGHSHVERRLRCGLAPTPRQGKHAASGSDHQTRPAGAYNRSRDRCHGGNSPSHGITRNPTFGQGGRLGGVRGTR